MSNKIALVTGAGMDSKAITRLLLSKNYHVFLATRRNTILELEELKALFVKELSKYKDSNLDALYLDVSDATSVRNCIEKIIQKTGILHEIYHLAAASLVSYSYESPRLNIETNGLSALFFLETIKSLTPKTHFYFAASTEMFAGHSTDGKYTENSKFYPKTPYGCSKILGFDLTRYFRETYGLFAVSGILSNHSNCERNISFFIRKITNAAAKISLGLQQKCHIGHLSWARDEMWADFAMEAAWKLLQQETPVDTIIGNGQCRYGEEYVDLAFNYFNLNWKDYIVYDPQFLRKNEVFKLEVDPALAMQTIGWRPNRMPFKDHIHLMCNYDYQLEKNGSADYPNVFNLYP